MIDPTNASSFDTLMRCACDQTRTTHPAARGGGARDPHLYALLRALSLAPSFAPATSPPPSHRQAPLDRPRRRQLARCQGSHHDGRGLALAGPRRHAQTVAIGLNHRTSSGLTPKGSVYGAAGSIRSCQVFKVARSRKAPRPDTVRFHLPDRVTRCIVPRGSRYACTISRLRYLLSYTYTRVTAVCVTQLHVLYY